MKKAVFLLSAALLVATAFTPAFAQKKRSPNNEGTVIIARDGKFSDKNTNVPANVPVTITIKNRNKFNIEIESKSLRIDERIPTREQKTFVVGPLAPGVYDFTDEYNDDAKGTITAK